MTGNVKKISVFKWSIVACMALFAWLMFTTVHVNAGQGVQNASRLWENATAYMAKNHWVPGKVIEHERTFNLKGKLVEENRFVLGFSPGKHSSIKMQLLSAEENGKDVSKRVRSTIDGNITLEELVGDSLFAPDKGQQVTSRLNGQQRRINGRNCAGFTFTHRTFNETLEGTAWLDQKTGLPVEVHSTVTSVPFMEDDV